MTNNFVCETHFEEDLTMGCLESKENRESKTKEDEQPVFSWDRADRPNPLDYTIADKTDEEAGKIPGTINGQQFIIKNCKDSRIYIFDHSATITVDDCENCKIFLGPVKGSVYFRNCKECQCIVACQQFRTRDCKKMETLLSCATQPIIESSTGMKFGCFQYYYPELKEQFHKAGLSIYNNNWSNIHDFTPVPGESNHSLLSEDLDMNSFFPKPTSDELSNVQVSCDGSQFVVPLTRGSRRRNAEESCLVVLMDDAVNRAAEYLTRIRERLNCDIIQTKEVRMSSEDAKRVFQTDSYATVVEKGPVVGVEINGNNCIDGCKSQVSDVNLSHDSVFVSTDKEAAQKEIDAFYNFSDMTMS